MRPHRRLAAIGVVVLALGAGGSSLAGCALARNSLGTGSSPCFRVLPEAHASVGRLAIFEGVRKLPGSALVKAVDRSKHHRRPPASLTAVARDTTCLVAYRGHFSLAGVKRGWAAMPGPYRAAVVVVRLSDRVVVVTVLFASIPSSIKFSHRFA